MVAVLAPMASQIKAAGPKTIRMAWNQRLVDP